MIPVPGDATGDCYLTTAEVAAALGVHRSYVSVMRSRHNSPPSFRFGKTLLTRQSAIATWLEEQEGQADVEEG